MFRHHQPNVPTGEERKDLFGPVADLMVGVIFIFIILLIGLALHLQPEDYQRLRDCCDQMKVENKRLKAFGRYVGGQLDTLFTGLAAANETRAELLEDMRRKLQVLGIQVTIDPTNGTLKLPSGGLFLAGQAEPTPQGRETIRKLGEVLSGTLPCYAGTVAPGDLLAGCRVINQYTSLSSAYIEGHTDVVPVSQGLGRLRDNWDLSAARAIETFKLLRVTYPLLSELRNRDGDTLLGVSGYAETRPATKADDRLQEGVRDLDRRIEVRLTMTANEAAVRKSVEELSRQLEGIRDLIR